MLPKQEEFFLDVRRAVRTEQKPVVTTDSELLNSDTISKALQRSALWLTPKVVEAYDPQEFLEWPLETRNELRTAVDRFRSAATEVPEDQPPTNTQFQEGLVAFRQLVAAVRPIVLEEWTKSVDQVVTLLEAWSDEFGWRRRRQPKTINETLLGQYSLPQLQVYATQDLYVLNPIGRFVPGALGALDLSIQPSFEVISIYRHFDRGWYAHLDADHAVGLESDKLTRDSFRRALEELRSLV